MILHFNYEELTALRAGAEAFLDREGDVGGGVLAPPEERARVQALLPMLQGDLSLSTSTLEELRAVKTAVDAVVAALLGGSGGVRYRIASIREGGRGRGDVNSPREVPLWPVR